jgi:ABC-type phosphate/phosphonate transport system substrate-binding protein
MTLRGGGSMKKVIGFSATIFLVMGMLVSAYAAGMNCWFSPGWKKKPQMAQAITRALSAETGLTIKPRIAKSYPEILKAFDSPAQNLVYVGSFVQAIIKARGLGTALVQNINGKDLYSGVLVYPKDSDPEAILKNSPENIAFARGASSGESSAKAATGGKANFGTANHGATCGAVKAGKAKAGVVKNWWWDSNKDKFSELAMYRIPGVSIEKNPDNVLTASNAVPVEVQKKIAVAAIKVKEAFGATEMVVFDQSRLEYPLELMAKGKIDPMTYNW